MCARFLSILVLTLTAISVARADDLEGTSFNNREYLDLMEASYSDGKKAPAWRRVETQDTILSPTDRVLAKVVGFQAQVSVHNKLGYAASVTGTNELQDWIDHFVYQRKGYSPQRSYFAGKFAKAVSAKYGNIPCAGDSAGGSNCTAGFGSRGNRVITQNTAAVVPQHIPANSSNIVNFRWSNDPASVRIRGGVPGQTLNLTPDDPKAVIDNHRMRDRMRQKVNELAARHTAMDPYRASRALSVQLPPIPNGGVRVAPSMPSSSNGGITQPGGGTAASYDLRSPANLAAVTPSTPAQAAAGGPGGISLTRAAAQKLNLNFDFDSASFTEGRLVLSGKPVQSGIDAAIVLTTLRLACESGDPYFSLDPDNGKAWSDEGQRLAEIFDARLGKSVPAGLRVQVSSARQHYGPQWAALLAPYPNFKTRLVFGPTWLKDTRVGEVLYKADVLLKELVAGTPLLRSETKLRAAAVDKYVPSQSRRAARMLLEYVENLNRTNDREWRGNRLWFDLVAQTSGDNPKPEELASPLFVEPRSGAGRTLLALLKERDYVPKESPSLRRASLVAESGNALDLSQVYPQMFVRRFDHASRKDLPGREADLDLLTADVNQRTEQYAAAYKELRDLTDVFRAYIIGSKYTKRYPHACTQIKNLPLVDAEKPISPLPEFHPSELFITKASYSRGRQVTIASAISTNGGIALRGKEFVEQSTARGQSTPITVELSKEVDTHRQLDAWQSASGRQFVALKIGADETNAVVHKVPVVAPAETPKVSGIVDRFEIYMNARITGTGLKSQPMRSAFRDTRAAAEECAKICSADANCVAFEVDEAQNRCHSYSTVSGARVEPNWMHGIWR